MADRFLREIMHLHQLPSIDGRDRAFACGQGERVGVKRRMLSPWVPRIDRRWGNFEPVVEATLQKTALHLAGLCASPNLEARP